MSFVLLLQLQGCAQIVSSLKGEPLRQDQGSAWVRQPHIEKMDVVKFREELVTLLKKNKFFKDGSDSQNQSGRRHFLIRETFFAASGELCSVVYFDTLDKEALFCRKSNGDIVKVRRFE